MSVEPRRIKKIVREPVNTPFPRVPVEPSRRGAITTQTVKVTSESNYTMHGQSIPKTIPGYVTLTQLAAERKIQPQLARLWVKHVDIKKPAGRRWAWKDGSRELARVRKALGLPQ